MKYVTMQQIKFSSQIDEKTLKRLKQYAKENDRSISRILTEAVQQYLQRVEVRPTFRSAANAVLQNHADLLQRLAK